MTSNRKHLLLCVGMMVVAAVPAAAQEPGGSAKKPFTPESLKVEIETLRLAKPAWREVAWQSCLLAGLKEARAKNKPILLWVFIDRPADDARC
jgi:hypothetical protein